MNWLKTNVEMYLVKIQKSDSSINYENHIIIIQTHKTTSKDITTKQHNK